MSLIRPVSDTKRKFFFVHWSSCAGFEIGAMILHELRTSKMLAFDRMEGYEPRRPEDQSGSRKFLFRARFCIAAKKHFEPAHGITGLLLCDSVYAGLESTPHRILQKMHLPSPISRLKSRVVAAHPDHSAPKGDQGNLGNCAKLLKTRRGEVAEWLNAAVC